VVTAEEAGAEELPTNPGQRQEFERDRREREQQRRSVAGRDPALGPVRYEVIFPRPWIRGDSCKTPWSNRAKLASVAPWGAGGVGLASFAGRVRDSRASGKVGTLAVFMAWFLLTPASGQL
jgi:hypothetical protein